MTMNPHTFPKRRRHPSGYTTMATVSSISFIILMMLAYNFAGSLRNSGLQSRAQVKQDYAQKEDAILNALIHIVPNKAIGAMRQGSANNTTNFTWDTIFREALTAANAEQSVSSTLLNSLSLGSAIRANSGDATFSSVAQVVQAPSGTPDGTSNRVNGGNLLETLMLANARIAPKLPAALSLSYSDYILDKQYPIISLDKVYSTSSIKGLALSPTNHPRYNLIQYPDVKFGYKKPGENFVAKRNWWVFSLNFGSHNQAQTGIPPIRKDYVLSIYEIPSQVPLSASSLLKVGKFADGTAWQSVSIDGALVADRLETQGSVNVTNGAVSARTGLTLSTQTVVDGKTLRSDFDALGTREAIAAQTQTSSNTTSDSNFYEASVGGNVGKVAFIPINRGNDTLLDTSDGTRSERISPTGWNFYSQAAPKAGMSIEIRKMTSATSQLPTAIRFRYRNSSNAIVAVDYVRGTNWPTEAQAGGNTFPFQTEVLNNGRNALIVNLDRLPAFINGLSGTGGMARNHSLHIFPTTGESTVLTPSVPAAAADMVVSLRGGNDLTAYTAGLSLVSRYRVYIASTLNGVQGTVPANSGLPSTHRYFPPLSIFAPEKRFGESSTTTYSVELSGQINSLKTGATDTVNPLEVVHGNETKASAGAVRANLSSLKSPAELPPIFLMNWLVTIEEVH
jgi:hypothetical protein